jgi:hypothetical protein
MVSRFAIVFLVAVNFFGFARAQVAPFAPISPRRPQECAAFAAQVDKYEAEINDQHERCLHPPGKEIKEDRPNLPPGSPLCSRSACQLLHDILYSDLLYPYIKPLRKSVDACYDNVKQYLDRQAREKREAIEKLNAVSGEPTSPEQNQAAQAPTPVGQRVENPPVMQRAPQAATQPYVPGSMRVQEPHAQPAGEQGQKQQDKEALKEIPDPFASPTRSHVAKKPASGPGADLNPFASNQTEVASNMSVRAPSDTTLDPFAPSTSNRADERADSDIATEKANDIRWDKTEELVEGKLDEALKALDTNLNKAKSTLEPSAFTAYREQIEEAKYYLKGLNRVLTYSPFIKDAWEASDDFKQGWNDFVHDCESQGFAYVLKRLSPPLSKVWEGPAGWAISITFDSSSTQTPAQDLDPMTVINDSSHYSFDERVAALQNLYVSQARHPEVWNDSKRRWLYQLTLQVYNSSDNPDVVITPR